jgi:hypothetical protein
LVSTNTNVGFVALAASVNGENIIISLPTQVGLTYQMEFKTNLADAGWTPLGGAISGNGAVQSVNDKTSVKTRFYRAQIQ